MEGNKTLENWCYYIIGYIIFGLLSIFTHNFWGFSKEWVIALFLVPVAVGAYFHNRKAKPK